MQTLQPKILEPVVLPVVGNRDSGCERKTGRHLGTIISASMTKKETGSEKVRLCFQRIVTKSFSFYPSTIPLLFITALQKH